MPQTSFIFYCQLLLYWAHSYTLWNVYNLNLYIITTCIIEFPLCPIYFCLVLIDSITSMASCCLLGVQDRLVLALYICLTVCQPETIVGKCRLQEAVCSCQSDKAHRFNSCTPIIHTNTRNFKFGIT